MKNEDFKQHNNNSKISDSANQKVKQEWITPQLDILPLNTTEVGGGMGPEGGFLGTAS